MLVLVVGRGICLLSFEYDLGERTLLFSPLDLCDWLKRKCACVVQSAGIQSRVLRSGQMCFVCRLIRVRSILDLLLGLIRVLVTLVADVGFSFVTYEGSFRFLLQASSNCRCRRRLVCDVMNDRQLVLSALLLFIVVGVVLLRLVDHFCGEDVRFVVLSPLVLQGLHVC